MDVEQEQAIKANLEMVRTRIHQAASRSGRNAAEIDLVAVTKQKSAAVVKTLVENNVHKIGESYLKEATFKIELLDQLDIEWHMIGNIQRGKEKNTANLFQVVHSVGSKRTAEELNKQAAKIERILPVYLELNVSGEITKQGWEARKKADVENLLPDFEKIMDFPNLNVLGLMTMAPYSQDPENARPFFRKMREIQDYLSKIFPGSHFEELSMGMSGDFEVAIEEGATVLRIGSALVGSR